MRLRQASRALASAAVLATCAASLTACGGGDSGPASASASASSSASSSGAPSASSGASSSASTGSGHLDQDGVVRALTVGQVKGGSAHMVMKLSGPADLTAKGDVDYSGGSPEMSMRMAMSQLGKGAIDLRLVDGIIYMHVPRATPAGTFLKIDPRDPKDPMAGSFSALSEQLDPLSTFRAMRSAVRSTRYVGEQTIGGDRTDHYEMTVDSAKLFKAMGQKTVPQVPPTLAYDLWFDGKDQLRRMQTEAAGERTQMTLSDWGKEVHVTAPPASKIVDRPGAGG